LLRIRYRYEILRGH